MDNISFWPLGDLRLETHLTLHSFPSPQNDLPFLWLPGQAHILSALSAGSLSM